ncbi:hypothetical protein HMPREF0208_03119 [Citrobacter koseri]|uniref:Uncharacterized protein n=1 Tax=Citrobacter koseri (strain ATCC BAA-895 / CDC 4225-83 / SGSC4696) TaxID=290338 RepID=A8AHI1_CITK8|nr:hypothetical protein CKO_01815 [Citrobacter koseri ATCC BAA-895]KWZ96877.1 hypothetical protein HMPREF3207_04789 [Citrobacter koseri]KWZ99286.1 hypothetical protein HMPREF3220_02205 [Citrobacter koseri]KXB42648.1 hypothetical protein HMPREF0208_03119 [Citrobacter koseri]
MMTFYVSETACYVSMTRHDFPAIRLMKSWPGLRREKDENSV